MKSKRRLTIAVLLFITAILAGSLYLLLRPTPSHPSVAPEEVGLNWQECPVSADYSWQQAESCFGHPMPLWSESDAVNFAQRIGEEGFRLNVGPNTYEVVPEERTSMIDVCYTLYRDGIALYTLCGEFTAYSPNRSLQKIGDKVAWEFADPQNATIIYDGKDLRSEYNLSAAYRPYGLGSHLLFIGQQDKRYFVMYDGQKVGPDFDSIFIAPCCEPALWSVQYGQGKYLFWGSRDGDSYVVEISKK